WAMFEPGWLAGRAGLVLGIVSVGLACCTLTCRSAAVPTPEPSDPFVVVRATAQTAYQSGKAHLDRGELEAALVDLDTAKTNDADNRQDIQQALAEVIDRFAAQTPTALTTAVSQRTLVVATLAAAAGADN